MAVYDTASEAEYPLLLCQRVAIIISKLAKQQGYQVDVEPRSTPAALQASSGWKVAAGRQPRGRKALAMLPEDGQIVELHVSAPEDLQVLRCWQGRSKYEHVVNHHVFLLVHVFCTIYRPNRGKKSGTVSSRGQFALASL